MGAKQFRQSLVATGMNPDDNAFSRDLIAMRGSSRLSTRVASGNEGRFV